MDRDRKRSGESSIGRRDFLAMTALLAASVPWLASAHAKDDSSQPGAPREMHIHKVPELGLQIWVENQPPWRTELKRGPHPTFIAQAPDAHHPPAVMSYSSWPSERVADSVFATMAKTAITRASQNFGLSVAQSRALDVRPARYGVLAGHVADFAGNMNGTAMDVRIFIGQSPGRFPVVLTLHTLRDKIQHLDEHVRRAWTKLSYL